MLRAYGRNADKRFEAVVEARGGYIDNKLFFLNLEYLVNKIFETKLVVQ